MGWLWHLREDAQSVVIVSNIKRAATERVAQALFGVNTFIKWVCLKMLCTPKPNG